MTILKADQLVTGYSQSFQSPPFSFEIAESQITGFFGANGSGKTTLIKTILGIIPPLSGSYYWQKDYQKSYLPQLHGTSANVPITVKEVLRPAVQKSVEDDLESLKDPFHAQILLKESFHKLSGGQKQRVLMTRVILSRPEVIFLDEPNTFMDQKTTASLWHFLQERHEYLDLKGVFIIDHNLESLKQHAHHIVHF